MRSNRFCTAAVGFGLVALSLAGVANADTLLSYELSGISFADGATAVGSFVFDASTDQLTAWDIVVGGGRVGKVALPTQTFDNSLHGNSVGYAGPRGQDLLFYADSSGKNLLNLYFKTSLVGAPAWVDLRPGLSFDAQLFRGGAFASPLRGAGTAGASLVAAVPEPSTLTLVLAGALVVGATLRRRSKSML